MIKLIEARYQGDFQAALSFFDGKEDIFDIDAQLPRRFVVWLAEAGHDARHTLDLPLDNRTPDSEIIAWAVRETRIVVTKDDDFVQSFLIAGQPSLSCSFLLATSPTMNWKG